MSAQKTKKTTDKDARVRRKKQELALILPFIGVLLLLTPILKAFLTNDEAAPLTSSILFIFGTWAVLIAAAFFLSRILVVEIRDK